MIQILSATPEHLPEIVAVHSAAFEKFFLTQLGSGFLRLYYAAILACPGGVLVIALRDRSVVGFAAGFVHPQLFYRLLRRRKLALALAAAPHLFFRPRSIFRFAANWLSVRTSSRRTVDVHCELSSLAVRPDAVSGGVGRSLLRHFVAAARDGGADSVSLRTDAEGNDAVNRFYRRAGFALKRTLVTYGNRRMNEYVLALEPGMVAALCSHEGGEPAQQLAQPAYLIVPGVAQ